MAERFPKGNECQCVNCGEFFSGESAFAAHQVGTTGPVVCRSGLEAGLRRVERAGGAVWGWPGSDDWTPGEGAQKASPPELPDSDEDAPCPRCFQPVFNPYEEEFRDPLGLFK